MRLPKGALQLGARRAAAVRHGLRKLPKLGRLRLCEFAAQSSLRSWGRRAAQVLDLAVGEAERRDVERLDVVLRVSP